MAESGEHGCRRARAPTPQAGISVRRVAHECEVIGNRCWRNAELLDDSSLITNDAPAPIHLNDPRPAYALCEGFVRRADDDTLNPRIASSCTRGSRQCIVGFEFNHRPGHDTCCDQRLLE